MFGSKYHIVTDDAESARSCIETVFKEHGSPLPEIRGIEPGLEDLFVAFAGKEN
ncbi:MAG: hypothetical protein LUG14_01695 [Synergistaceae bacterium]|nr:hypothetical protein [Synergistaceae bacterium]